VDANLQTKLLWEAQELYEKRARVEASLRAAEALSKQRIEIAALREIQAYRNRDFTDTTADPKSSAAEHSERSQTSE
jgi:hypothetical protein